MTKILRNRPDQMEKPSCSQKQNEFWMSSRSNSHCTCKLIINEPNVLRNTPFMNQFAPQELVQYSFNAMKLTSIFHAHFNRRCFMNKSLETVSVIFARKP